MDSVQVAGNCEACLSAASTLLSISIPGVGRHRQKFKTNLLIQVWWRLAKLWKVQFKLPLWPHKALDPPEHKILLGFAPDSLQTRYTDSLSKLICHKVVFMSIRAG